MEIYKSSVNKDEDVKGYGTILESGQLKPRFVKELIDNYDVYCICLGHGDLDKQGIIDLCRENDKEKDWSYGISDEDLDAHAEKWAETNENLKVECPKYGIEYIDTHINREETLNKIMEKIEKNGIKMNRLLRISFDTLLTSLTPILGWFLLGILVDENLINIFSLIYPIQFIISAIKSVFGTGANVSRIRDNNKNSVYSGILIGSIVGAVILGIIVVNIDKYISFMNMDIDTYKIFGTYGVIQMFLQLLLNLSLCKLYFEDENYNLKNGNSADLLGHSYEGTHIVENYLSKYDIDEQFKNQVIHMIGSHMNEYSEWGALVLPKMLEVIIISFADDIDSHLEPAHNIIKNTKQGELYKIGNAPRPYYKSLNPFYNKNNK